MRAHCPRHSIFSDNYKSCDQHILVMQAKADEERADGVLDIRGPFTEPPFSPMRNLSRGAVDQNGSIRGTVDAGSDRSSVDLWADSWLPSGVLEYATTRQHMKLADPDVRRGAEAKEIKRQAVSMAADEPSRVCSPKLGAVPQTTVLPAPFSTRRDGRPELVHWIDGVPVSPNEWTDVSNRTDFPEYTLPNVLEFGHDVAIVREFARRHQLPYAIGKADWKSWYRQLRRAVGDLWLSCWMVSDKGIDCDMAPYFGGTGCCNEGNGGENILLWVIHYVMSLVSARWESDPNVMAFTAARRTALARRGIEQSDPQWDALFSEYRQLLRHVRLRKAWNPATRLAWKLGKCQDRLRRREEVLGYRGWFPRRNLQPFSLKGFFDDSFFVGLAQPFEALIKVFVCLRARRVRSIACGAHDGERDAGRLWHGAL